MMMTRIMELSKHCAQKIARKKSCSWNAEISTISTNGLSIDQKCTIKKKQTNNRFNPEIFKIFEK